MVPVVHLCQFSITLLFCKAVRCGKFPDAFRKTGVQVLFADTADVGILRQHGDVAKIVQSAEDAEFSDFGHTRKEAELDAAVHSFQDTVEPLQGLPVVFLKVGAVKVVDKGFVVFVDENHDRPAGFFISSFDSVLKPCIGLGVFRLHVIFRFNFVQMLVKRHVKILPGLICLSAQIDMQDRVFRPVMLQRLYRCRTGYSVQLCSNDSIARPLKSSFFPWR